ncbi:MAG: NUDIX domain-containing protein [Caldilineaceae bacterium]
MKVQPSVESTRPITAQRRYPNAPLVGVAAAVFDGDGRVLLVRRGRPPRQGQWGLPGGLLDLGERLIDGARREVREECAIEVKIEGLITTFEFVQHDHEGQIEYHYVVLDYWARHVSGEAVAQDDADAVQWVLLPELAEMDLNADTAAVIAKAFAMWMDGQNRVGDGAS